MAEENTQGQGQARQRARKMARRSGVYQHFTSFKDPQGKDKARCKYCDLELGANTKNGTSNLWTHVRVCNKKARDAASHPTGSSLPHQLQVLGPGESSDREASRDLARMIVLHGHDPSVVEDDYFRSFVRRLNPEFKVPTRLAIEEMCDGIFDEAREDLLSRLSSAPGRISLAVGIAKTMEEEVLYVACHFIDDEWNLHKLILHATVTGVNDHDHDHHSLYGPILGFHVSGCDTIDDFWQAISYHRHHKVFMLAYETTGHVLKNYSLPGHTGEKNCTTYVDNVLHSIARCLRPDGETIFEILNNMQQLHWTRQERLQLLSELDLDYEWAYDEQWCACYYSLKVLSKRGVTKLGGSELIVKFLCKVWEQVYRGIKRIFPASTCPTSNLCLAELLKLREFLHFELAQYNGDDLNCYYYDNEGEEALREASNILDKAIQDLYLVWSVPLALDPRYKLKYIEFSFPRVFGLEAAKYVSEVTTKINKLYADYSKEYGAISAADHSESANTMIDTTSADPMEQAWNEHCRSQDVIAAQFNSCSPETQMELNRYLQDRLVPSSEEFDVLNWWKVHGSNQYPMVARMARDALAMPTCMKLSSDQVAQVRSILHGYSKKPYGNANFWPSWDNDDFVAHIR